MEIKNKKMNRLSITKTLLNRQLTGNDNKELLSYSATLGALQNLKPTVFLESYPNMPTPNTHISGMKFNRKGNLLANSYWGNDKIQIWDWAKKKLLVLFNSGHGFSVKQFDWLPADSESLIVTSGYSGDVGLMDLNKNLSRLISIHGSFRFSVHESLPYRILAGNEKGQIINIDFRDDTTTLLPIKNDFKHANSGFYEIGSMHINPMKCYEFVVGSYKDIRIYDYRQLSKVQKLYTKVGTVRDLFQRDIKEILNVKYNYNGSEILAASSSGPIYVFNILENTENTITNKCTIRYPIKSYNTAKGQKDEICFTLCNVDYIGSRGEFITASSITQRFGEPPFNNIYVWDKETEDLVHKINLDKSSHQLAVHPAMPILAVSKDHRCNIGMQLWQ